MSKGMDSYTTEHTEKLATLSKAYKAIKGVRISEYYTLAQKARCNIQLEAFNTAMELFNHFKGKYPKYCTKGD